MVEPNAILAIMDRSYWKNKALTHLQARSVLWLSGVRRVGKTTLVKSLGGVNYFDCELPSVRAQLENPERFLKKMNSTTVVLDEVHRLLNPSEVLKIAADHFQRRKSSQQALQLWQPSQNFETLLPAASDRFGYCQLLHRISGLFQRFLPIDG